MANKKNRIKHRGSSKKLNDSEDPEIQTILLPLISDDGNLIFGQEGTHFPFPIKRIYYMTNIAPGLPRGYHAHKTLRQILFCIQGSVKIVIDNRHKRKEIILNKPNEGLIMNEMIWYEMHDFQEDTILLVLASDIYYESDYIRSYNEYRSLIKQYSNK